MSERLTPCMFRKCMIEFQNSFKQASMHFKHSFKMFQIIPNTFKTHINTVSKSVSNIYQARLKSTSNKSRTVSNNTLIRFQTYSNKQKHLHQPISNISKNVYTYFQTLFANWRRNIRFEPVSTEQFVSSMPQTVPTTVFNMSLNVQQSFERRLKQCRTYFNKLQNSSKHVSNSFKASLKQYHTVSKQLNNI